MTADDLATFIERQFEGVNRRIDDLRSDFAQHRKETTEAIAASNSRIDTLTHWMMTSLVTALLAAAGAVASLFHSQK